MDSTVCFLVTDFLLWKTHKYPGFLTVSCVRDHVECIVSWPSLHFCSNVFHSSHLFIVSDWNKQLTTTLSEVH